jgi:hypothetical protein
MGTYQAEHYGLVLWNHGGGWEPSEMDRIARQVHAPNYHEREAVERSGSSLHRVFFRSTLEEIFQLPTPQDRAICSDDDTGHSLDTVELGNVLAKIKSFRGKPLDVLGMDACLMSNLEVAYQAQPYVDYIVASEESEPNDGWPYDAVLDQLTAMPDMTPAALAEHIVKVYIESYLKADYAGAVTQSALNTGRIGAVTTLLDQLAVPLIADMATARYQIWDAQLKSAHFFHDTLWDIGHFVAELAAAPATVKDDIFRALNPAADGFVLAESHHGPGVELCQGVSIYLPVIQCVSSYYGDLTFAKQHKWHSLLKAYRQ